MALEIGSDLAGSLRLPAAYCGVYALRTSRGPSPIVPTRGHIPRPPGWATSSNMITLGPIARTVEDLGLLLDVIAAPSPADRAGWKIDLSAPTRTKLGQYRVGIWDDDAYCRVDADTRALLRQVADLVLGLGATVDHSTRPVDFADSDKLFQRLMYATASAAATDETFAADIATAEEIPADDPSGLYLHSRKTPAPQRYITVDGQKRSFYDQTSWLSLTSPVGLPSLVLPAGKTRTGLPLAPDHRPIPRRAHRP